MFLFELQTTFFSCSFSLNKEKQTREIFGLLPL